MATIEQVIRISHLDTANRALNTDCNEDLLAMCAQQSQAALRELYNRFEKPVYGMLLHTLNNRQDAEEALSDVFIKVWKYAGQFKGNAKFTTWLYRIAANTARDYLRNKASRQKLQVQSIERVDGTSLDIAAPASCSPEEIMINASERKRILDALQELSGEDRMMLVLYHFQEMAYDDICSVMNISHDNLKVRLFRARQRLKKLCYKTEEDSVP